MAWGMTSALTRHLFKFRPIQMSLVAKVSELGRDVAVARTHIVVVRRIVDVFMMPSRLECQATVESSWR